MYTYLNLKLSSQVYISSTAAIHLLSRELAGRLVLRLDLPAQHTLPESYDQRSFIYSGVPNGCDA